MKEEVNEKDNTTKYAIIGSIAAFAITGIVVFWDNIKNLLPTGNTSNANNGSKPNKGNGSSTPPAPPQPDQFVIEQLAKHYKEFFSIGFVHSIYEKNKPHLLNKKIRLLYVYSCYSLGLQSGVTVLQRAIKAMRYTITIDGKIGNQTTTLANKATQSGDLISALSIEIRKVLDSERQKGKIDEQTYQTMTDTCIKITEIQRTWQ